MNATEIKYKDTKISLEVGTVTLHTKDKKLTDDVVVTATEEIYEPVLQEKAITVSGNGTIEILPDDGFDGLSKIVITVEGGSGGSESNFTLADGAVLMTSEGKVFEVKEN